MRSSRRERLGGVCFFLRLPGTLFMTTSTIQRPAEVWMCLTPCPFLRLHSLQPSTRPSIYQRDVRPPWQSSILVESAALSPISQRRVFELQSKPLARTPVPSWILTSPEPGFNLPDPRTAAAETIANLIIWSDINPPLPHPHHTHTHTPHSHPQTPCPHCSCCNIHKRGRQRRNTQQLNSSAIFFCQSQFIYHINTNTFLSTDPPPPPSTSTAAYDTLSLSGPKTPSSSADKTWMQMMPGWFHFFIFFLRSLVQYQNGSSLSFASSFRLRGAERRRWRWRWEAENFPWTNPDVSRCLLLYIHFN